MVYYPSPSLPVFNDLGMYKTTINLQVAPSQQTNGLDLPLHDIDTLRFFFNLGVRHSRLVRVAAQQPAALPPSFIEQQLQQLRVQIAQQELQMQQASAAAAAVTPIDIRQAHIGSLAASLPTSTTSNPMTSTTITKPTPIMPTPASAFSCPTSTRTIASVSSTLSSSISPVQKVILPEKKTSSASNPIINQSELAFSDSFRKEEAEMRQRSVSDVSYASTSSRSNSISSIHSSSTVSTDKSDMAPMLMVSYLNSCIRKAKQSLRKRGISISTVDENGKQVDFSCRPIDPIFKEARARFDQERCYAGSRETSSSPDAKRPRLA